MHRVTPAEIQFAGNDGYSKVAPFISARDFARIPPRYQQSLALMAANPEPPKFAMCFAPDSDPKIVEAFEALRVARPRFQFGGTRWTKTATNGTGLGQGSPTTLTYSFIPDGTALPASGSITGESTDPSSLFAFLNGIYGTPAAWQAVFAQAFARWSALSGITYTFQATDDGASFPNSGGSLNVRGDVRIGGHSIDGPSNILAYNFFPPSFNGNNGGDMVIDTADTFFNDTSNGSLKFRNVICHEHCHGLGFDHVCPINQTKLMEPFVTTLFDGPQHDDIRGVQRQYGDRFKNNTTSASAADLGTLNNGLTTINDVSIDGSSEIDFYKFTVQSRKTATVTLRPVGLTYLEGPQNGDGTCSAGTSTNSLIVSNLTVSLLDTNGSSVLSTATTSAGNPVTLSSVLLPAGPGTFFVRVNGGGVSDCQLYALDITLAPFSLQWDADANAGNGVGGGAGTWNTTTANWFNGATDQVWNNSAVDAAIFGGTAGAVTLGVPITAQSLQFNTSGYALSGSALTLSGTAPGIDIGSGTVTINSILAGTSGFTKSGAGNLVLSAANTYSGATNISGGVLQATANNVIPSGSALSLSPVTTFAPNNTTQTVGSLASAFVTTTSTFSNAATITIPSVPSGNASPYPSPISVSGMPMSITSVSVTLNSFSHSFPEDVDVCLVGPQGQNVMLMSDVSNTGVTNVTLNISDSASNAFTNGSLVSNSTLSFRPTNLPPTTSPPDDFPAPGPGVGPYGTALSLFNGTNPNGTWSLFVVDSFAPDGGSILGWSITITSSGFNTSSSVTLGSGSLTAGGANTSTTFNGTISGTGGNFTKAGTGTLTLGGTNSHTGVTTVNNGALKVNGTTASSSFTVAAAGTLSGTGTAGAITCTGTVLPGDTQGTLTAASANFSSGGALRIAIPSNASASKLQLSGALTMGGTSKLIIDLAGYTSGMANANFTVAQAASWSVGAGFSSIQVLNNSSGKTVTVAYDPITAAPNKLVNVGVGSIPTAVTIEEFSASAEGAGVTLTWTALSEIQNLGFNLYRRADGQEWVRVNSALISGRMTTAEPKLYCFSDWPAPGRYEYKLESVSAQGTFDTNAQYAQVELDWIGEPKIVSAKNLSGVENCFACERSKSVVSGVEELFAPAPTDEFARLATTQNRIVRARGRSQSEAGTVTPLEPGSGSKEISQQNPAKHGASVRWFSHASSNAPASYSALKVTYREPGVLLIPRASFPAGFDPEHVVIQREGRTVSPLAVTPEGLLVHGPGYRDEYTDTDAIFLRKTAVAATVSSPNSVSGLFEGFANTTTQSTASAEFHETYFDYNFRPFDSAPWFSSKYLTQGTAQEFALDTPGAVQGAASLQVKLWSLTTSGHALQVLVNGQAAGRSEWSGGEKMLQLEFNLPGGVLRDGANEIQLVTPELYGVPSQTAFVYSISISYSRRLDGSAPVTALNNGTGSKIFEVDSLASPRAWVVDARYEDRAVLLGFESRARSNGKYALRFTAPSGGSGKFVVIPAGLENRPASVTMRQLRPLQLNGAYLAVGPSQFVPGVQPLLMAHAKRGMRSAAVEQERIFDAYGFGRYGPAAIRAAVRALRPRYLLLLGRTTYDYLNYSGENVDPLCPAFLVPTTLWAQTTSDAMFGDLGRGFPEVAVGRLPVNDTIELAGAVRRILNYSGAPASGVRAHAVSDRADPMAGEFAAQMNVLAGALPEISWQRNFLGVNYETSPEVTAHMTSAASGGADWIVYAGHGNASRLGNEVPRILDAEKVQAWTGSVVFLQATCTANWMALNQNGYRSIAIQALTQPQGGICASIGSSTYMNSDISMEFMQQLLANANRGNARWGEALMLAQQWALRQKDNTLYQDSGWTEQLFGDPAMPVFQGTKSAAGKVVPGQF